MDTSIIVALIASIPPSLVAYAALRKSRETRGAIQEVHISLNHRLDQLLDERGRSQRAEGVAEGQAMTASPDGR